MTNFKVEVKNGQPVKTCIHCGEYVSLGSSGTTQMDFTLHHVVKHSKGPVFVNVDPLELVAEEIRPGRYAIRPKGSLGTCGSVNGQLWTVKYVNRVPKGMKLEA